LVYGIDRGEEVPGDRGKIYLVNMATGDYQEVGQIPSTVLSTAVNLNTPNGFAYDQANKRLYYSVITTSGSELYFYDLGSDTNIYAGSIVGNSPGASFYNGKYYYIDNNTDDLYIYEFDGNGLITGSPTTITGISGGLNRSLNFGDIAIQSDGVVYGAARENTGSRLPSYIFFRLTLDADGTSITTAYNEISTSDTITRPQIAIGGGDRLLYGATTGSGQYHFVDTATGALTNTVIGFQFNDLASGECP
jgi:hypothetical protein